MRGNERQNNERQNNKTCGLFFYSSIFIISSYFYVKFVKLGAKASNFDRGKKQFFAVLAISALLDLPIYVGCLAYEDPSGCYWEGFDQLLFWFLHLFALCGYAYCLVIPCIMWSDTIHEKDGKIFFSSSTNDPIKRYFQILILVYFLNNIIVIIASLIQWKNSDKDYYINTTTYSVGALIECILICLLSIGCLYCGIRLQYYVRTKLKRSTENQVLFTLNTDGFSIFYSSKSLDSSCILSNIFNNDHANSKQ